MAKFAHQRGLQKCRGLRGISFLRQPFIAWEALWDSPSASLAQQGLALKAPVVPERAIWRRFFVLSSSSPLEAARPSGMPPPWLPSSVTRFTPLECSKEIEDVPSAKHGICTVDQTRLADLWFHSSLLRSTGLARSPDLKQSVSQNRGLFSSLSHTLVGCRPLSQPEASFTHLSSPVFPSCRPYSTSRKTLVQGYQASLKRFREQQKRAEKSPREQDWSSADVARQDSPVLTEPSPVLPAGTPTLGAMHQQQGVDLSGLETSLEQPSPTQPLIGPLRPTTPEEEKLAALVARPDLLITRQLEFLSIFVGFEQQNRYVILDPHKGQTVGFLLEQSNPILRQLLRRHCPWTMHVYNAAGELLYSIKRKFFFISSTATVEIGGKEVGWVHRRWHLWKRNYDAYIIGEDGRKTQFAAMENGGFWWWTFTLRDEDGHTLAEIDRNFRGLGLELFTDAGQYMVRFGDVSQGAAASHSPDPATAGVQQQGPISSEGRHKLQEMAQAADQVPPLDVVRPLSLAERAVTLAMAVSVDNDFFSRHSGGGGVLPFGLWSSEGVVDSSDEDTTSPTRGPEGGAPPGGADDDHRVFPTGPDGPLGDGGGADQTGGASESESGESEDSIFSDSWLSWPEGDISEGEWGDWDGDSR